MQHSQVDRDVVNDIFRSLRGRFGNAFVDKFRSGERVPKDQGLPYEGMDIGLLEAIDVWVHELRNLSPADIRHGLESKFRYPPSADEFVQACCSRDYAPPASDSYDALPAPTMSREEAEVHIAQVHQAAKGMQFPSGHGQRMDNWLKIADEVARGVYKGGTIGKRYAAEALAKAGRPVPEALQAYLPKTNPMEDAA
ncbi:hypothetical protein [Chromobacterium subtsugae]|uniref:hypothetical protein n=1 Tax=Chromobacterium subtsugae TaxID=251747 RepID=UPI0007F8FE2E|nr:hypothetical protein [Chromobacterium subtsugae]OBU85851.1 hypothetical protein MY55_13540 [Chromobacterium subtsugae]